MNTADKLAEALRQAYEALMRSRPGSESNDATEEEWAAHFAARRASRDALAALEAKPAPAEPVAVGWLKADMIRAAVAAMPHTNPGVADDLLSGDTMHTEADDVVAIFCAGMRAAAPDPLTDAAPELLEALILMVRTHDEPAETMLQEMKEQQWLDKARAAIAKATGAAPAAPAEPVAWRIRIGASDVWGYSDSESDADFYGVQSGLPYVKQPLYAAPAAPAGKAQPLNIDIDRGRVWIKRGNQSFMMAYEGDEDELQWYCDRLKEALSGITPDVKTAPAAPALHPDERADLAERIGAAHEASLDGDHRACCAILTECLKMLAFPKVAPMTGPKVAFWVYEWLHPTDGSVTLRSLRPEDHCRKPDRAIPVPLMDEWVQWAKAAAAPLRSVHLTRDTSGMCVVSLNGFEVIRDNGDVIDHMATPSWLSTYAAPAAPAPLTDEQISELAHEMVKGGKSINWLLRAIERAHGIGVASKGGAA